MRYFVAVLALLLILMPTPAYGANEPQSDDSSLLGCGLGVGEKLSLKCQKLGLGVEVPLPRLPLPTVEATVDPLKPRVEVKVNPQRDETPAPNEPDPTTPPGNNTPPGGVTPTKPQQQNNVVEGKPKPGRAESGPELTAGSDASQAPPPGSKAQSNKPGAPASTTGGSTPSSVDKNGDGKPDKAQVKNDEPSKTKVIIKRIATSTVWILALLGLALLMLWLGFVLGYKSNERSERKFVKSLRDIVRRG